MMMTMMMRYCCLLLTVWIAAAAGAQQDSDAGLPFLETYRQAATERWEDDIQKLEAQDKNETDPADAVLFIGSSSIRRWDEIAIDMAPYRTIRRGYGGAKYSDLAIYAQRLLHPHQYRALVMFVGNDVSGSEKDHTPEQVEQLVRHTVDVSHRHQPTAPVFLIEVTPTGKRWSAWTKIRAVNVRLREIALSTPNTYFIATAEQYLWPDGTPRVDLFVEDQLHLNSRGYDLWAELIRRRLDEVFRRMAEASAASEQPVTAEN